jgi:hypothetical protein
VATGVEKKEVSIKSEEAGVKGKKGAESSAKAKTDEALLSLFSDSDV